MVDLHVSYFFQYFHNLSTTSPVPQVLNECPKDISTKLDPRHDSAMVEQVHVSVVGPGNLSIGWASTEKAPLELLGVDVTGLNRRDAKGFWKKLSKRNHIYIYMFLVASCF